MSGFEQPNRFEQPFASDQELGELLLATRNWVTTHGRMFMEANEEIYGIATEVKGGLITPTEYMVGTDPIRYGAVVRHRTLWRHAPEAARALGVNRRGMLIQYDEPYYYLEPGETEEPAAPVFGLDAGDLDFMDAELEFRVFDSLTGPDSFTNYLIRRGQEDTISSTFDRPRTRQIARDGSHHHDLKVHECVALRQVVRVLGGLAQIRELVGLPSRKYFW